MNCDILWVFWVLVRRGIDKWPRKQNKYLQPSYLPVNILGRFAKYVQVLQGWRIKAYLDAYTMKYAHR